MKKSITIIFSTLLIITSIYAQEKYARARVYLDGAGLEELAKARVDVHEGTYKAGVFFETDYSLTEIDRIRDAGFRVAVLIEDVQEYYRQRTQAEASLQPDRGADSEWPVPENWEYGSMAGFYTLDEAMAELDSMYAMYPGLITARASLSDDTLTHDGRKQWWCKISDNPNTDEDEPEVLYTAVHHAREVISVQQTIFYMWYLLENYATDPEVKYIVDNTELYFVPVLNPDGYQYNVDTEPNGGGMWRKNRRNNGDGSFGVDPNRNYAYKWGIDDLGSSPFPGDGTYRGPAPFSEPENKNIRDFCNAHEFQIALNYHSYSNLLLSPWGYTPQLPEDIDLLLDFGALMTLENKYTYGPGYTTIYQTNGSSDDWMYGEQDSKDKIFAYTPEVGGGGDGFWPQVSRIIPLCQEQMWQNLTAARLVGKYAVAEEVSPVVTNQIDNYATFNIKRMGLTDTETFTVSIDPLDAHIVEVGEPVAFDDMTLLDTETDSIAFLLDAGIEEGTEFSYLLSVDNGEITYSDTVTRIFGTEVVLFYDDGETMDRWSSTYWDITGEEYWSPENSITDSPGGNYPDSRTSVVSLDTTINLYGAQKAFLRFAAKWDIEPGYDYVQLLARNMLGGTWTPLEGKYTTTGTFYQQDGEPVYDGISDWVWEEIDLEDFLWTEVQFRFLFRSDNYVNEDGFYFDDFTITVISNTTDAGEELAAADKLFVSDAYPNPAGNAFRVQYRMEQHSGATLELYNAVGNLIKTVSVSGNEGVAVVRLEGLPSGIYYYRMVSDAGTSSMKKVLKVR